MVGWRFAKPTESARLPTFSNNSAAYESRCVLLSNRQSDGRNRRRVVLLLISISPD